MYVVLFTKNELVPIVRVVVVGVTYIIAADVSSCGLMTACGVEPNAVVKVKVHCVPPLSAPVPVVIVTVPAVSLPATVHVAPDPAFAWTEAEGVEPPVIIWPLTVIFPEISNAVTVTFMFCVSAVNNGLAS